MDKTLKVFVIFIAWMMAIRPVFPQQILAPIIHSRPSTPSCSPPTMTARWAAYNSANTCTASSVPCTNGAFGWTQPDLAGTNSTTNATSLGPIYTTSAINGLPSWTFTKSSGQFWRLNSSIPQSGSITFYAILNWSSTCTSSGCSIFGLSLSHGLNWQINAATTTTGHQRLLSQGLAEVAIGTQNYTAGVWYTVVTTYNFSTGAWSFYNCAAGTCSLDSSGTGTSTFSASTDDLGAGQDTTEYFGGQIAEWGYLNSANTSGIAAWSQCKYGI